MSLDQLIDEIGGLVAGQCSEAYYVGGCVRDALRGAAVKDVDFALKGETRPIGGLLADRLNGHVFFLREEDQVVRVLLPEQGGLQIDLSPLRGTIDEDLRARDLTINAMGLPASTGLYAATELLDPTGGRRDLEEGQVRFTSSVAPESDPLRTLRALRFRWKLGFELAPGMREEILRCAPLLERVSAERIRDELFQLLSLPNADCALAECLEAGLGRWIAGHDVSVERAGDRPLAAVRVRSVLDLLIDASGDLAALLQSQPTPPRSRRELLLLAAVLQVFSAGAVADASARSLALSGDERQTLGGALRGAEIARDLVRRWPVPGRQRYRMFCRSGCAGPEAVLLAAAVDGWSGAHEELLAEALRRHFWPQPPLLSGVEVMQILNIGPGPRVGQVLEEIEEARADGLLRTAKEAADWLRERDSRP